MLHRTRPLPAILLFAVLISACTSEPPPKAPVQSTPSSAVELGPGEQQAIADSYGRTGGNLDIDPDILALCPKVKAPVFGDDPSRVRRDFEQALISIAECMQTGRMKDKTVVLVGHAEGRGDADYRLALGGRRADSVRYALVRLDVPEDRIHVSSSDEIEAAGRIVDASKQERRVDVKLAGP